GNGGEDEAGDDGWHRRCGESVLWLCGCRGRDDRGRGAAVRGSSAYYDLSGRWGGRDAVSDGAGVAVEGVRVHIRLDWRGQLRAPLIRPLRGHLLPSRGEKEGAG